LVCESRYWLTTADGRLSAADGWSAAAWLAVRGR